MIRSALLRVRDRVRHQSGVVLVMSALLLPVIFGMVGFAVDFGWLYWNGIRIQHGADAAALAGVIYEPDDRPNAYAQALASAAENGYNDLAAGTVVDPTDAVEDPSSVANANQLRVTITHAVPTFFGRIFGLTTVNITKTAVAEYVLPLPLGSPDNRFGNDPATGDIPNFWGNIHGYYTGRTMGDRYSSQCIDGQAGSGCTRNPDRRPTVWDPVTAGSISNTTGGYLYGIEVDPGASNLSVEIFDGPFTRGGGDFVLVGDQERNSSPGPTTAFILYGPDPTPLDTTDSNVVLCTVVYSPRDPYFDPTGDGRMNDADDLTGDGILDFDDLDAPGSPLVGGVASLWDEMCPATNLDRGPGIYPLRVLTLDDGEQGLNRWSLRTTTSSGSPRVYGLGDMAIYSNVPGGNTEFYLSEVEEVHAGKDLVITLWDPGEAAGTNSIDILTPQGSVAICNWSATNGRSGSGVCNINTTGSPNPYNNHLVEVRVDLADDYVCAADCWWKIRYNYPNGANDTTTWEARIEGNPVKLVE